MMMVVSNEDKAVANSAIRAHIILNEKAISQLYESDESGKHVVFRCKICLYSTLKRNNIENHVITHTDIQTYKCQSCPFKTNYKQNLVEHCKLTHDEAPKEGTGTKSLG